MLNLTRSADFRVLGPAKAGSTPPLSVSIQPLRGRPFEERTRLQFEELAEPVEGVGMQAPESPARSREPVSTGITQLRATAQRVGSNTAPRHDLMNHEPDHGTFRV